MARRRGSVAPASTRRCKIPLSMLQHGLHNLPHSSKHVDVLELMLRCSRLVGQLPSGLSARPVPLTRAGTSSRAAGVARRTGSMHVSLGRMPWCHGGPSRAGRGVGAFATRARCVGGGVGRSSPSVAFMRCWAAGRIVSWSVLVFGAKWFPGIAAVNYFGNATCRAAGSPGHARGPEAFPFLEGSTGEVEVRGAVGSPPSYTSGILGGLDMNFWDDGGAACGPPRGPAAALPSDPGPRGKSLDSVGT